MNCRLDCTGDCATVVLEGEITLPGIALVKETLMESLIHHQRIMLDLRGVSEADLSFLQVLWSAQRYAATLDRKFGVTGPMPLQVSGLVAAAGYSHASGCRCGGSDCLWTSK